MQGEWLLQLFEQSKVLTFIMRVFLIVESMQNLFQFFYLAVHGEVLIQGEMTIKFGTD